MAIKPGIMQDKRITVILVALLALAGAGLAYKTAVPDVAGIGEVLKPGKSPYKDKALIARLAPHKALYDITLSGTKGGSQIANVSGQMYYEWQPDCEGWVSNHRFNLSYEYADTPPMNTTSDFSIYESFDGKTMNFSSRRRRDGQTFEDLRGNASILRGKPGMAEYTMPEALSFELPEGTLFPMGHTLYVMKAIAEKRNVFNAIIFDGSDAEGPVEVSAFIGPELAPEKLAASMPKSPSVDGALLKGPGRNVRLAFFPMDQENLTSEYEMTVTLLDNGVISEMDVDYDEFSVRQTLRALEAVPDLCAADHVKP